MNRRYFTIISDFCLCIVLILAAGRAAGQTGAGNQAPDKIYVPYKELKDVFESEQQGVFLPYADFQKLWRAAMGSPAVVTQAPFDYLISSARFKGAVKDEIASINMELTIDVLGRDWVNVPLSLGGIAVSQASLLDAENKKIEPLLRFVDGQYIFTVRGTGRYVLSLDFVRQLQIQPGLAVLNYQLPSAAITTLDLLIPQKNLKVDVSPMLAATTSQTKVDEGGGTLLQAFLGSAREVRLSWKPQTEAAAELEPVLTCEQLQQINIDEALISYAVTLSYDIHRGRIDTFTLRLPEQFRITDVNGVNIARWEIEAADKRPDAQGFQQLKVNLFSPVTNKYTLIVRMERFVQQEKAQVQLAPVLTEHELRLSGLIGITYSPHRIVHLENLQNLARVDAGQLPKSLQGRPGITAYRFLSSDYSGTLMIEAASPRITVNQRWLLGVDSDRLYLRGQIRCKVERTGVFELNMNLPEPWQIESVGPNELVDDFQLKGQGPGRILHILLKRERLGDFELVLTARSERTQPDGTVDFTLPLADVNNLQLYEGQVVLQLAEQLAAQAQDIQQLQSIPLG
jgi:hypothetical protein